MASAVLALCKVIEYRKNETFYQISKKILKLYNQGVFLSQKELAVQCFVSEALITQFAQRLKFSGYRELHLRLEIEYETALLNKQDKISSQGETFDDILVIHNFIKKNLKIITKIADAILANERVAFITSGQANDASRIFIDSIKSKGFLNISLINPYASGRSSRFNEPLFGCDKYFFIFIGMINPTEISFYEECLQKVDHSKIFSLITKGKKIDTLNENNINLNLDVKFSDTIYRNIILNFLFLEIINSINKMLTTL
ncbi:hypothetical protein CXP39_00085 [Mesoplasma syrphidae]|uniref:HTH rpiR-type domain-containing protein n=1 Tax=Mesoplasma syrphidae TaxID=225999 RepID=A0A2K9C158_9MOLU|nr:hypothetical protein [Mesoplasma syrphidae]AUF83209.1 hypothetical protein CXP39_00085 [Mesoplasma syrphidae]